MTKRKTARGPRRREKPAGIEWVGGTLIMPAYVTGEGAPYRPAMLAWLRPDGTLAGTTLAKPGELFEVASKSLQEAIGASLSGPSHAPTRLRVSSPELADLLRAGHPTLDIVCAPTPELDEVLAALHDRFAEEGVAHQSYLAPDIEPAAIASFFGAAALLFRVKPWKIVRSDQHLLSLTIEQFGLQDAVISVIGQMGESLGLVLFSSMRDFEAYLDAGETMECGAEPNVPHHFAMNFERGAELAPELRKEISEHGWEVAAANAYPWLVAIDEDLVARPPTAREVATFEAIALALLKLLSKGKDLRKAWEGGPPVALTVCVPTHDGEIEVTLRAPYERAGEQARPSDGVLASLWDLAHADDEIDPDARVALEDDLVAQFADSPEARGLPAILYLSLVIDFAVDYFGTTIAALGPVELEEMIFEIFVRKVSMDPSEACAIIEELRAFYGFLKRELAFGPAAACLSVLGGDAVGKLEAALSDPSHFGMAKSLFTSGHQAGFDMESQEGIDAWIRASQGGSMLPSAPLPRDGEPGPAAKRSAIATKANKNKRKSARKARKKSR